MKKQTKSNWQTKSVFATISTLIFLSAIQIASAQDTKQGCHLALNYLFPSAMGHNLWLKDSSRNFELPDFKSEIDSSVRHNSEDEYPTPDFSAMAKYIEVKKWEYDIYATPPQLRLLIMVKEKSRPRFWTLRWEDADGVLVATSSVCDTVHSYPDTELNVPLKCNIWIPDEGKMKKVKTVRAVKRD